jgi:membrane-bound ClpP family serine protease
MFRIIVLLLLTAITSPATAYVGPGAGISVLGSLLGILATIFVAIGAILFWPIRKLIKRKKAKQETGASADTDIPGNEK